MQLLSESAAFRIGAWRETVREVSREIVLAPFWVIVEEEHHPRKARRKAWKTERRE